MAIFISSRSERASESGSCGHDQTSEGQFKPEAQADKRDERPRMLRTRVARPACFA